MSISNQFATSTVLRRLDGADGVVFFCPACKQPHQIMLAGPTHWTAEGTPDHPTFWPSVKVFRPGLLEDETCHSFVTLGRIAYQADSTHAMAGTTVDIPLWPHKPKEYGGVLEPIKK